MKLPWCVIVPTALALVLRVRGLAGQTLWADELHVANAARRGLVGAIQEAAADVYPPLHYAICALLGGGAAEIVRVPSVVAGVGAVWLVSFVARQSGGALAAWIAGGWLALLPAHMHYAQEGRSYALLGLLFVALIAAQERWKRPVVAAWCTSLCLYTHGLAPLLLLGPLTAALWRRDLPALFALAAGGLTFLPWLGISIAQRSRFSGWGGYDLPVSELVGDVVGSYGAGELPGWLPLGTGGLVLGVGLMTATRREHRALILTIAVPFVALLASAFGMHAVTAKHFSPLLPAFALVLATTATMGRAWGFATLTLALGSGFLGLRQSAQKLPVRFDIQAVVAETERVRPPGAPVFGAFPNMWRYYLRGEPVLALPPPMDLAQAREILAWQTDTWGSRSQTVWWWMQAGQDRSFFEMGDDWPFVWIVERAGAEGMAFTTDPGENVPLQAAQLDHVRLEHRDRTLGFYGNGAATVHVPHEGMLAVWLCGSMGEGRAPTLSVRVGEQALQTVEAATQLSRVPVGAVHPGDAVTFSFEDDYKGASGDRNVWVTRVEVFTNLGEDRAGVPGE